MITSNANSPPVDDTIRYLKAKGIPATFKRSTTTVCNEGTETFGQSGAISTDNAVLFDGSSGYMATLLPYSNPGPFSVELWFNTTTSQGGKLIGFGDSQTGGSGSYDRHLYMTNSGQLILGIWNGGSTTVQTSSAYNDGAWHHAVGTWASGTLSLYVDGALIGAASGSPQNFSGFWRLGYDNIGGWPSGPSSYHFAGKIDEAAVYGYALTSTQVANHYHAGGH